LRAFESATQCYKFLFFRSLLDRGASSDQRRIALVNILADMIESAWWPIAADDLAIDFDKRRGLRLAARAFGEQERHFHAASTA
jgi:hypothetical protein